MSGRNTPHYLLALDMKKNRPPEVPSLQRARCQERAPRRKEMRGMQMTPKGTCAVDTLSVRTTGFSQFCCVLILSHLFKISFAVFITEKSEQD